MLLSMLVMVLRLSLGLLLLRSGLGVVRFIQLLAVRSLSNVIVTHCSLWY